MTPRLRLAWASEMSNGRNARAQGDLVAAFAHFERAHILGQCFTLPHVRAHLAMLAIGWQQRDSAEVRGQIVRIVAAALFTRIWIPVGNTGGANVSALKPMPLPPDLRALVESEMAQRATRRRTRR